MVALSFVHGFVVCGLSTGLSFAHGAEVRCHFFIVVCSLTVNVTPLWYKRASYSQAFCQSSCPTTKTSQYRLLLLNALLSPLWHLAQGRKGTCLFHYSLVNRPSNVNLSCVPDPLVHHGRHFCRTIHALCNIQALLTNGILRSVELADVPAEEFTAE
jgi:hypothetical protein